MLDDLKAAVCRANRRLAELGLAPLTWGNASGVDRTRRLMVIKPSGRPYAELRPADMVVVDFDGRVVEGGLRPSSDTPLHLGIYAAMPAVGGIVHTHSRYATMFAQARRPIPCLGTTHADHFFGPVPLTRPLTPAEVAGDYEAATATTIVERFANLEPLAVPAVLVAAHGPFAWGGDVAAAVDNAAALEAVAEMAFGTLLLAAEGPTLEPFVLEKHFQRKHGPAAYYGQH